MNKRHSSFKVACKIVKKKTKTNKKPTLYFLILGIHEPLDFQGKDKVSDFSLLDNFFPYMP